MRAVVRFRKEVPDDLREIVDYLAERNQDAAARFVDAVRGSIDELAGMPGKGSLKKFRERKLTGVRSWLVPGFRKYLILYRPIENGIEVMAVIHGARKLSRALKGR